MKLHLFVLLVLFLPAMGSSHHSRAAYDTDNVTVIEGELVGVRWRNPHIVFSLRVNSEDGTAEVWRMEAGSIYMLNRGGVTKELFDSGVQVQVAGHLSINEERDFLANSIRLQNGREIMTMPNVQPHWTDETLGGRDQWLSDNERLESIDASGSGMFQVWSVPKNARMRRSLPFKQAAVDARANWDLVDNVITQCQQPGLPRIMFNPHPFEFVENAGYIELLGEEFDMVRTIYLDQSLAPQAPSPSNLGHSVGRWEGGSLVVHTTHINWPYFDGIGTPQSEAVEVLEKYTLSEDQRRLDFHFEVIDPVYLDGPANVTGFWLALGEKIEPFNCEVY